MSPNLLQGQRLRQSSTGENNDNKTRSSTPLGEDKSGEISPGETHCETVTRTRTRDRDCQQSQGCLIPPSTGKVKSVYMEVRRHSFDLQEI